MLILIIGALIGVVVISTLILVLLYIRLEKQKRGHIEIINKKIVVDRSGADVNSGHLGSGSLFNGYGQQRLNTICINENAIPQGYSVRVRNVNLIHIKTNLRYDIICGVGVVIGRTNQKNMGSASIALNYPSISSIHCRIFNNGEKLYVEDCNSTNGTYLNGRKITVAQPLHTNDVLKLGNEEFQVIL